MNKSNLLVTGSSGYLGSHLLSELAKTNKYNLTGLDFIATSKYLNSVKYIKADINETDLLLKSLDGIDIICHCASLLDSKPFTKDQYFTSNIKGTQNLYNSAKKKGINKIILTSSVSVINAKLKTVDWPVNENIEIEPEDFYGKSKKEQEMIARNFAEDKSIQTLALRPCAFFPIADPERGFRLTGSHAMIEDIVNAHVLGVEVLLNKEKSSKLNSFEAIFITNKLPYKNSDKKLIGNGGKMKKLIKKYWPDNAKNILELGYKKAFLQSVYDLRKAKSILNWQPNFNFDEWLIYCKERNLNFDEIKNKHKAKKSLIYKIKNIFKKIKS